VMPAPASNLRRRVALAAVAVGCVIAALSFVLIAQDATPSRILRHHLAGAVMDDAPTAPPLQLAWEGGLKGESARVHCAISPPYECAVVANAFWVVGHVDYTTAPGPHVVSGADVALLSESPTHVTWTDAGSPIEASVDDEDAGLPPGVREAHFVPGEPAIYAGTRRSGALLFDWRIHQRMQAPGAWEVPRALCVRPWAKDLRTGAYGSLRAQCAYLDLDHDDGSRLPAPIVSRHDLGHYSATCVCSAVTEECRLTVRLGVEVSSGGGSLDGIVGGSESAVDGGEWQQGWSLRPFGSISSVDLPAGGSRWNPQPARTVWLQGHSLVFDRQLPYPLETPPGRVCTRAWVQNEVTAQTAWIDLRCLVRRNSDGEAESDCGSTPGGVGHATTPVEYCSSVSYSLL